MWPDIGSGHQVNFHLCSAEQRAPSGRRDIITANKQCEPLTDEQITFIRAQYRGSMSNPSRLDRDRTYSYEIDLWAPAMCLRAGTGYAWRYQVAISPSSTATNSGNTIAKDTELRPFLLTVFHNGQWGSHINRTIVPR